MNDLFHFIDGIIASPASSFWLGIVGIGISIVTLIVAKSAKDAASAATQRFSKLDMIRDLNKAQEKSKALKQAVDDNLTQESVDIINELRHLLVNISETTKIEQHNQLIDTYLAYLNSAERAIKNNIHLVGSESITSHLVDLQRIEIRERNGVLNER